MCDNILLEAFSRQNEEPNNRRDSHGGAKKKWG